MNKKKIKKNKSRNNSKGQNILMRKMTSLPPLEYYQYQNEKIDVSKSIDILPTLKMDKNSLNCYKSTLSAIKKV